MRIEARVKTVRTKSLPALAILAIGLVVAACASDQAPTWTYAPAAAATTAPGAASAPPAPGS
ncbi:MAG: hypothetical protein ABIZ30_00930, partial [Candidatus Limnocylindrales bacterium]